jgi:hypothetical protein
LAIVRTDQAIGESAGAFRPVKQRFLNCSFILECKFSRFEQGTKHMQDLVPFESVPAPEKPFQFDQDKQGNEHGFLAVQSPNYQLAGALSLTGVVRHQYSHDDVGIDPQHLFG